eukprot:gb/GEZN01006991.1/.p1 GENE.gb/GEZN01006991.1/~~gb/GEZN01006991.1/.p1  ORF type:complete len:434 (+),score=34.09 gb/GEZN01006991.1/:153-1454(+)
MLQSCVLACLWAVMHLPAPALSDLSFVSNSSLAPPSRSPRQRRWQQDISTWVADCFDVKSRNFRPQEFHNCLPTYPWSCLATHIPAHATPAQVHFCLGCCHSYWMRQLGFRIGQNPSLAMKGGGDKPFPCAYECLDPTKHCGAIVCKFNEDDPKTRARLQQKLLVDFADKHNAGAIIYIFLDDGSGDDMLGTRFDLPVVSPTLSPDPWVRSMEILYRSPQLLGVYVTNHQSTHELGEDQMAWFGAQAKMHTIPWGIHSPALHHLHARCARGKPPGKRYILLQCQGLRSRPERQAAIKSVGDQSLTEGCLDKPDTDYETNADRLLSSKFVLSPPGTGIQCYRTWEALYCGAIPVIPYLESETALYDNLPVLRPKEGFAGVTAALLNSVWDKFEHELHTAPWNYDLAKLYEPYWIHHMFTHWVRNDSLAIPYFYY